MKSDKNYYWLAVNGSSCAASPLPMRSPKVVPTPQQLLGFDTREEQLAVLKFVMEAPIEDVCNFMRYDLACRVREGKVAYARPARPQPPAESTIWLSA